MIHSSVGSHRDLKPANILIEPDEKGNVKYLKITDFGLSTLFEDHDSWCGSPPYMAPEYFAPDCKKTNSVDIWAFGVILYELLFGEHPFWDGSEKIEHITPKGFAEKISKAHEMIQQELENDNKLRKLLEGCL